MQTKLAFLAGATSSGESFNCCFEMPLTGNKPGLTKRGVMMVGVLIYGGIEVQGPGS